MRETCLRAGRLVGMDDTLRSRPVHLHGRSAELLVRLGQIAGRNRRPDLLPLGLSCCLGGPIFLPAFEALSVAVFGGFGMGHVYLNSNHAGGGIVARSHEFSDVGESGILSEPVKAVQNVLGTQLSASKRRSDSRKRPASCDRTFAARYEDPSRTDARHL